MSKLVDAIERVLFGATAQETVEMRVKLAELRLEQRIIAALEADEADDDEAGRRDRSDAMDR